MTTINRALLKSRFRGCLLGSLVGDCFGAPFAGDTFSPSSKVVLQRYFDKLDGPAFKAPVKKCTKDTIMSKCIAQTLVEAPSKFEPTKLAKLFVKEYFVDPKRGYTEGIRNVFHKLRANKFTDPFKPAMEQTATSDNSAAMRVSPIALFYHDNFDNMLQTAKTSAEITHVHKHGVSGAILHCLAVHQSLMMTSEGASKLDVDKYVTDIVDKLKRIEKDEEGLGIGDPKPFASQMEIVQELLSNAAGTPEEEVVEQLGHSMLALYSIPTAIFCFLRAQTEIENIETSNPFRRTLQYAISLGGDTATIAGLAGSIAGAYHGEEQIGKSMLSHCENREEILKLADQLFNVKYST